MKRIMKKILLTLLVITLASPSANAGVVKKLVEVDPQQQQIEEEEVKKQQEEYKKEAVQEKDVVEKAKQILDEQIKPLTPPPAPAPVKKVTKHGKNDYSGCFICKPIGVLTGIVVGPIAGLVRGSVSKAGTYAGSIHDGLGEGIVGKLVGYPVGAISGGVTGAVSGMANGFATGLVKGYTDPFTAESYSLQSGDYDPYNFLGGQ